MCGIAAADSPAADMLPFLLEDQRQLEYHGYDPARLAVLNDAGAERVRTAGQLTEIATTHIRIAACGRALRVAPGLRHELPSHALRKTNSQVTP